MDESENIALFDMDNTLCDYEQCMFRSLEALRSEDEPVIEGDYHGDLPEYIVARMSLIKSQPGWWLDFPKHVLGMDVYNWAIDIGFTTHVLTKGPNTKPRAWKEKLEWCKENLYPETKVTITQDKGLVYGKVLVEDYPEYIKQWLKWRKNGLCIMIAHDYNKDFTHPNVIRYDGRNYEEVKEALRKAYER